MNEDLIALIRATTPNKIAAEILSVQPIDVSLETLRAAGEWLETSRLRRGAHPITEELLTEEENDGLFRSTKEDQSGW